MLLFALACRYSAELPATPAPPPLYGFWGLNGFLSPEGLEIVKTRLGLTVFQTATTNPTWAVQTLLPMAKEARLKVTLRMSGDHPLYTTHGDFQLQDWKAMLKPWVGSGVQAFIDDGTLVGHMLLDDIENFEGHDPTGDELEEMAKTSKELFPGLMTFVRQRASKMPVPSGGSYHYLDAAVNQYRVQDGEIERYARSEAEAGARLKLKAIHGLNIANGGNGESKQPGWGEGRYAMSAAEILRYGSVLLPGCVMFLNWEYDGVEVWSDGSVGSVYFQRPEVEAALRSLGTATTQSSGERREGQ
jgi:hypothetical protein